jgi:hypothetical protein
LAQLLLLGFYIGYQLATGGTITLQGILLAGLGGATAGAAVFAIAALGVWAVTALARAGIMFSLEAGLGAELVNLFSSFMNVGASLGATAVASSAFAAGGFLAGFTTGVAAKALHLAYTYQSRVAMWTSFLEEG